MCGLEGTAAEPQEEKEDLAPYSAVFPDGYVGYAIPPNPFQIMLLTVIEQCGLWVRAHHLQLLLSCATLGHLLNISVPQLPYL